MLKSLDLRNICFIKNVKPVFSVSTKLTIIYVVTMSNVICCENKCHFGIAKIVPCICSIYQMALSTFL